MMTFGRVMAISKENEMTEVILWLSGTFVLRYGLCRFGKTP